MNRRCSDRRFAITVAGVRDEELVYHYDTPYVAILQDGRQLDGILARHDGY
jgi:hypothetical protein